jgi:hypothetical protein
MDCKDDLCQDKPTCQRECPWRQPARAGVVPEFLPTTPGTQVSFTTKHRSRPCWRCRFLPAWLWRKHWGCRKPIPIKEWVS